MKKIKISKKPFFSKFLEKQVVEDSTNLKGGGKGGYVTMKYPSDDDEGAEA